ncbi:MULTISPECIES: amino acid ABC transporter substrate-binding protein [unclassified Oceanispirochaeta]|uniref:amino acid ABC transporter substrate-binding protein n=1 Tax=unclassified Oceanispirochaeta TaxID=2635722 RepID=UPI000E092E45|nr:MULTISPECIES: amino acid ABC transporter substrate-binding protein [unclassified Oceanispirochaeta]MBF9016848.1 amino acid ABC transporter substrate-binding protein [Oceanispirochaeta sp. M2]NPD73211.1 amino acid ABC transporter substrate-binding protein [Oceanispirochaeta sp. M1]RDG31078.1 amino acid ABC transporter substrate-binding protein [Oceanispirochaeta sp. M1]
MKKILMILMITLSAVMAFATGSNEASEGDNSLKYIQDKGVFVLGLDDSFPPMGFRDENGEVAGFDIDLAKEVCKRMGVELKMQPIDWDAKILDLNSKDIDVIWNGLSISDERKEKISFSKPYIANRQIIIVQAASGIDTKADLADQKVGVQLGSTADDAVNSDEATVATLNELVKFQDNIQALMDLEVGRIDAVVVDEILGRYYISKKPGVYDVAKEDFAAEEYGIGFRKGEDAFVAEVNRIMDEMVKDGSAAAISKKWFAEDILLER